MSLALSPLLRSGSTLAGKSWDSPLMQAAVATAIFCAGGSQTEDERSDRLPGLSDRMIATRVAAPPELLKAKPPPKRRAVSFLLRSWRCWRTVLRDWALWAWVELNYRPYAYQA